MNIPPDSLPFTLPATRRGTRSKYFGAALLIYFALFALFALASWHFPADDNRVAIFASAITGAWTAVALVWLFSDGRTDDGFLRAQILIGIALDLLCNGIALRFADWKMVAAIGTSIGNLGVLMAAVGIGLWVARGLLKPNYLVMASIVGALTDIFSVYAGPTKHLLSSSAFGFLAFGWGIIGRGGVDGIVGAGDFIFLALFFSGARRFNLDDRRTLIAMSIAIVAGFLSTLISPEGIPALPFFAVALLLAHGRELKAQMKDG